MSDEQHFQRADAMPFDFAKLQKLITLDVKNQPYRIQSKIIGKYKREDIDKFLETPEIDASQKTLRYISRFLYNYSNHYKRVCHYFADLLTLDHVVEPYGLDFSSKINAKKFRKAFDKNVEVVELLNVKHEFKKLLPMVFRDGIFYGYLHVGKDSAFIQALDPDYCKISSIEDGCFNFAFNFTYFNVYPEKLNQFPEEFRAKHELFVKDGTRLWQELDSKMTICIKFDELATWYPIPPFVAIFYNILEIEDFKQLRKTKDKIDNYKLIHQKIPMREGDQNNDFLLTLDYITEFHSNAEDTVAEQIGVITSPLSLEVIDFEKDKVDKNRVADAEKELWNALGVSQLLFTGDTGAIGMKFSIKTDEMIAFTILRQLERWVNRFLKNVNDAFQFRVNFLNITEFNKEDVQGSLLKSSQFGIPVKSHLLASLGMNPSVLTNMSFLENDVLQLHEKLIPLISSHTQTQDEGKGTPKKKDTQLTESGAKTRDQLENENK